ncbi:hypothetical protein D5F01_LYC05554 [Larimichthys crocea]|uniref:Uncharacterized protein n=1 Tax=Larimichthys crocea TaxID=215358 RepID=A0A6G0IZB8_LARCR|nr:hypothetical protein D5F01_LYC05554 [Larimichthys crocea]
MFSKLAYAAATPYNWSRYAISSVLGRDQMEALARQLEEMKSQLQRAEENGSFQERKVRELSGNLEHETTENKTLWDQVQYLTNELGKERDGRKRHVDLYRQEILKNQELNTLNRQLFQQVQDLQSKQACMMSVVNETPTELETLTREYNILCRSYDELNQDHTDLQEKYEMDINAKEEMTANLEKKLEIVKKICANRIKDLKTELQKTKDDISEQDLWDNDLAQKLESESAKNRTLCEQVERLNKKLGREKELKKQLLCQVEEMKEKNDMDINTEKQRIVTLVEKLEMMEKEIARKISKLDHLIYENQKTEHDTNLLKEQVSERDMELERLKILLHEQTSKNNEVVAQLQTEKDLNGILHAELETLKDQRTFNISVSQNPEPVDEGSSCDSQNPEPVDEGSSCDSQNPEPVDEDPVSQDTENAVVTTRKPSLWKKTCHFLCLRKKNMQRNVQQQAEFPRVSHDLEPLQESSLSVSQDSVVESDCVTHSPEPVVKDSPSTSEDTDLKAEAEGCDENAAVTMRKPSLWKQTRHFLGLRKKRSKEMCSSKSPSVSQAQQLKGSEK